MPSKTTKLARAAKVAKSTKTTRAVKATKATKATKAAKVVKPAKSTEAAKSATPVRVGAEVLGLRALNRALLERQMLLTRAAMPAIDAIEHLAGIQAQEPKSPYVGLWSRLKNFRPEEVETLLTTRQAVRIIVMRGTIHLVSARDCMMMRPLIQPNFDRWMNYNRLKTDLAGVDMNKFAATARRLFEEKPRTVANASKVLAEKWPGRDLLTMGIALRALLPLVQCPPRGLWNDNGDGHQVVCATAEQWLGRPLDCDVTADGLILRYLAAFGPSTIADMASWSGLTRLGEVGERLRPRLRVFHNEAGKELFDLPDAPRPDADTPAPVRFLPEFDNALLAYADRSRIIAMERRNVSVAGHRVLLVDGFTRATWRIVRKDPVAKRETKRATKDAADRPTTRAAKRHADTAAAIATATATPAATATLIIDPFEPLSKKDVAAVMAEGHDLLKFAAGDATTRDVRINPPA